MTVSLVGGDPGVTMSHTHTVKIRGHVLYPKRMKYSKYSKCKCSRGREPDGTQLGFGRYGTKSIRVGRLSYRAIEATRRVTIGQFHCAMSGQLRRNCKIWYIKIISIVLVVPCWVWAEPNFHAEGLPMGLVPYGQLYESYKWRAQ
jgi:hypothetical protein